MNAFVSVREVYVSASRVVCMCVSYDNMSAHITLQSGTKVKECSAAWENV